MARGSLGSVFPHFSPKKEQRRPAYFPLQPRKQQWDAVEWPGLRVTVEKGSSGAGGSEEPPQGGCPPLCVQRAKQVRFASL